MVDGEKVAAGNSITITFTFDYWYADGTHGSHLIRRFKKIFLNPSAYRTMFEGEMSQPGTEGDDPGPRP
jgi:hypothetical protein